MESKEKPQMYSLKWTRFLGAFIMLGLFATIFVAPFVFDGLKIDLKSIINIIVQQVKIFTQENNMLVLIQSIVRPVAIVSLLYLLLLIIHTKNIIKCIYCLTKRNDDDWGIIEGTASSWTWSIIFYSVIAVLGQAQITGFGIVVAVIGFISVLVIYSVQSFYFHKTRGAEFIKNMAICSIFKSVVVCIFLWVMLTLLEGNIIEFFWTHINALINHCAMILIQPQAFLVIGKNVLEILLSLFSFGVQVYLYFSIIPILYNIINANNVRLHLNSRRWSKIAKLAIISAFLMLLQYFITSSIVDVIEILFSCKEHVCLFLITIVGKKIENNQLGYAWWEKSDK